MNTFVRTDKATSLDCWGGDMDSCLSHCGYEVSPNSWRAWVSVSSHSVLIAQRMSVLGSVECHNEHRMFGLGTLSLRQWQNTG